MKNKLKAAKHDRLSMEAEVLAKVFLLWNGIRVQC